MNKNGKDEWRQNIDNSQKNGITPVLNIDYDYLKDQATVDFESEEGQEILNTWIIKWVSWLQEETRHKFVVLHLSGGCDSRILLTLCIMANVMNRVIVFTRKVKEDDFDTKYADDLQIVEKLSEHFKFKINFRNFEEMNFKQIYGLNCNFKTTEDYGRYHSKHPELYGEGFKPIFDKWLEEHKDADDKDKYQVAYELTFNQWHDLPKEKLIKNGVFPFDDLELKKLKNKGYKLWKYFLNKYCPDMLNFPIEGRTVDE